MQTFNLESMQFQFILKLKRAKPNSQGYPLKLNLMKNKGEGGRFSNNFNGLQSPTTDKFNFMSDQILKFFL